MIIVNEKFDEKDILYKLDQFQKSITVNREDEMKMRDLLDKKHVSYMIDDSRPGKLRFQLGYPKYNKIRESIAVDGFDPLTGEPIRGKSFTDPGKAIEYWFKMNQKNPTCISINPSNENDGMAVLRYFKDHESEMRSLHSKYNCRYKFDYMINSVDRQLNKGKTNMQWSGDQLDPFSLG